MLIIGAKNKSYLSRKYLNVLENNILGAANRGPSAYEMCYKNA